MILSYSTTITIIFNKSIIKFIVFILSIAFYKSPLWILSEYYYSNSFNLVFFDLIVKGVCIVLRE